MWVPLRYIKLISKCHLKERTQLKYVHFIVQRKLDVQYSLLEQHNK